MGWDSFGLPAEQYAIQTGQHPKITTEDNISATASKWIKLVSVLIGTARYEHRNRIIINGHNGFLFKFLIRGIIKFH